MIAGLLLQLTAVAVDPHCVEVSQDRVLAGDLARKESKFAELPADLPLTFSPFPGTQRFLGRRELAAFLRKNGLDAVGELPTICVERHREPLREENVAAAIRTALNHTKGLHLEIIDYPRQPLPPGVLQFTPGAASSSAPGRSDLLVLWPGRLVFDQGRSLSIWVSALVWVEHEMVVASEDLAAGKAILTRSINLEWRRESPFGDQAADQIQQVAGHTARRAIRRGFPIMLKELDLPWTVFRGDKVLVRVLAGSAHISVEAVALSSGHVGDAIDLRNPLSGRVFKAVVDAKGTALLERRESL